MFNTVEARLHMVMSNPETLADWNDKNGISAFSIGLDTYFLSDAIATIIQRTEIAHSDLGVGLGTFFAAHTHLKDQLRSILPNHLNITVAGVNTAIDTASAQEGADVETLVSALVFETFRNVAEASGLSHMMNPDGWVWYG